MEVEAVMLVKVEVEVEVSNNCDNNTNGSSNNSDGVLIVEVAMAKTIITMMVEENIIGKWK